MADQDIGRVKVTITNDGGVHYELAPLEDKVHVDERSTEEIMEDLNRLMRKSKELDKQRKRLEAAGRIKIRYFDDLGIPERST
jgi:hypothetical protein